MRQFVTQLRRGMVFLAALLSLWAPLAKLDCHCSCGDELAMASVPDSQDAQCHHRRCCGHHKHLAAIVPRGVDRPAESKSSPGCQCPPSCPCHISHAPQDAAVVVTEAQFTHSTHWQLLASVDGVVDSLHRGHAVTPSTVLLGVRAVSRCALLCRFIV